MEKHVLLLPVLVLIAGCTSAEPDIAGVDSGVDGVVTDVSVTDTLTDARADTPTDSRTDASGDLGAGDGVSGDATLDGGSDASDRIESGADAIPDSPADAAKVDATTDTVSDSASVDAAACVVADMRNVCSEVFRSKYAGQRVCCTGRVPDCVSDPDCRTGVQLSPYCDAATGTLKYGSTTCVIPF